MPLFFQIYCSYLILVEIIQDVRAVCGGIQAEQGQFKYIGAIEVDRRLCGGAIIDERHVLTAAHCIYEAKLEAIEITIGTINLYDGSGIKTGVVKKHIPSTYKHTIRIPDERKFYQKLLPCIYPRKNIEILPQNDIAVLTLKESLELGELTSNIDSVKLPETDELPVCSPCEFAGWGVTKKNGIGTEILLWNTMGIKAEYYSSNEFLAIDDDLCTAPFPGDSGGPLVCNGIVVGIISSGKYTTILPTIFTKVFSFMDFINGARNETNLPVQ